MDVVQAAEAGDLERVQELVLEDPQMVNYQEENKHTPLEKAVKGNHLGVARFLLQHGADPYCKDYCGETPIIVNAKCWAGNLPMLDLLLESFPGIKRLDVCGHVEEA